MCDVSKFEAKELADAAQMVNDMVQAHIDTKKGAMAVFEAFGQGNFDADMPRLPRKKVFINNIIDEFRTNVKELNKNIGDISDAIVDGNLAFDFDASKFNGEWGKEDSLLYRRSMSRNEFTIFILFISLLHN